MERRALLIFADSSHTDSKRRGWPGAFRILLETQSFNFEESLGFDLHLSTSRGFHRSFSSSLRVHLQDGVSFGQRLENAVESLAKLGYREIVIAGRDCPDLELRDILRAFEELDRHALVLGPDHRGGCYLIGIHASDRMKLRAVQWQRNTDFRALLKRFGPQNAFRLAVKMDLDTWGDIRLLARSASRWRHLAGFLLCSEKANWTTSNLSDGKDPMLSQRIDWQLPPPRFAAFPMHL
jgi:glycosyltransferase A (GT-A) superfamily protein (DUF2064 family)